MNDIIKITSVTNARIKYFLSLTDKKNRTVEKRFLIEGFHLVEEALKSKYLETVISTSEEVLKQFPSCQRYLVTEQIIDKLSSTKNPQPILGVVKMLDNSVSKLNNIIKKKEVRIVLLDDVNDPGNLGTIIRTTAALGYDAIVMSPNTVDLYNEKVIRSTQGVLFKLPIIKSSLEDIILLFKQNNIKCFGTSLQKAKALEQIDKPIRFAICFGNEARGMSDNILNLMDQNIKIDMANDVESLNVGIAAGIILYQWKK